MTATVDRRLRVAALASWLSYGALLVALLASGLAAGTPAVLLALALAPLLLFVPGMRRRNHRSFSYLCFAALLYFVVIVTNLFKPDRSWLDVAALIAVVALFVAAMLCSRWLQRQSPPDRQEVSVNAQE